MVTASSCPRRQDYERILAGVASQDDVECWSAHLETCAACEVLVLTMHESDDLLETLRSVVTEPARSIEHRAEEAALIDRLCGAAPFSAAGEVLQFVGEADAPSQLNLDDTDHGDEGPTTPWDFLAPAEADDELGRLGPYRILKVLGKGGMGIVFEAEDPALARKVAIKAMLPSIANRTSARRRFLREARLAAALKHDHIVTLFQVGEDRGIPYLAMELLEGEALDARLRREGTLPIGEVLRIAREAAEGLAAAHAHGLVHRDIKPANIWLESRTQNGVASSVSAQTPRAKILDFGLARAIDGEADLTHFGMVMGTPAYMSPEQADGKDMDCRADLFSLGCVMYRMCGGQEPFRGSTSLAVLVKLTRDTPQPPRELNALVPLELSDLILRLLEKDAKHRLDSALEVVLLLKSMEDALDPNIARLAPSHLQVGVMNAPGAFGPSCATLAPTVDFSTLNSAAANARTSESHRVERSILARALTFLGIAIMGAALSTLCAGPDWRIGASHVPHFPLVEGPREILHLADLERDSTFPNRWRCVPDGVVNTDHRSSELHLPITTDGDYQLQVELTQTGQIPGGGPEVINLMFPVADRQVKFALRYRNEPETAHVGITMLDGKGLFDTERSEALVLRELIVPEKRHQVIVRVGTSAGQASLAVSLDGRNVLDWTGPFEALGARAEPSPYFGIGARKNRVIFHCMQLLMLRGLARPAGAV